MRVSTTEKIRECPVWAPDGPFIPQHNSIYQMRHLDLLSWIVLEYPEADALALAGLSRDGLLAWVLERQEKRTVLVIDLEWEAA